MKKIVSLLAAFLMLIDAFDASGQVAAIKTNVLSDLGANVNLGVEVGMAKHWTFDINGNYNNWTVRNRQWKHWFVQPEFRYWFCERFQGNFIAINAIGGRYNFGGFKHMEDFLGHDLKNNRYQGSGWGAGLAYGHSWIIAKHFNIEAEIGVGWIFNRYDRYGWTTDDLNAQDKTYNYFGPTKAAVNFVYLF